MLTRVIHRFTNRGQNRNSPYVPGNLGASAVSDEIFRDYGSVLSRRERKRLAREQGIAFRPYYNERA